MEESFARVETKYLLDTSQAAAMEAEGRGIANQRVAIAQGIRDSIDVIQGAELDAEEANRLFEFTQYIGMMEEFAHKGASTVVLPSEFSQASPMLRDLLVSDANQKAEE